MSRLGCDPYEELPDKRTPNNLSPLIPLSIKWRGENRRRIGSEIRRTGGEVKEEVVGKGTTNHEQRTID
jgi:hypothetical protein